MTCVSFMMMTLESGGVKRGAHVVLVRMEDIDRTQERLLATWRYFGEAVRTHRKHLGMTQAQLADALGAMGVEVHQSTVAKLESASRPTAVHEVWAIATILGVEYGALLAPLRLDGSARVRAAQQRAAEAARNLDQVHEELQLWRERLTEANTELANALLMNDELDDHVEEDDDGKH